MMKFLAKIINFSYKLHLPLPISVIFQSEKYLLSHIKDVKIFLSLVHPAALWKIANKKVVYLANQYIKKTPALQEIKRNFFPKHKIKSVTDFKEYFPILDKENYIKKYPMADRCQSGKLPHAGSIYKSAGTSGTPTFWIENLEEEFAFNKTCTFIATTVLDMPSKEYIVLNCFAMGAWPTGIGIADAARFHGKTVNVGTNIKEAVNILKVMGPSFNYLIAGYPPFIYELFGVCEKAGLDIKQYQIDIVSAGEGFIEEWREEILQKVGYEKSVFSVYGTTDKGLGEGIETNFAYTLRSLLYICATLLTNQWRAKELLFSRFGQNTLPFSQETAKQFLLAFLKREENIQRLPMIFQFNPSNYYNENFLYIDPQQGREVNEFLTTVLFPEIGMPRLRYNIHDEGFIMTYEEVRRILDAYKINIQDFNPRRDAFIDLHLPFLFIFGRSDGTVSVDGANIFPEDVEDCLIANRHLHDQTHSFQMFVTQDHRLGLAIELKEGLGLDQNLQEKFKEYFKNHLEKYSFGYTELVHDRLRSSDIVIEVYAFGGGPFKDKTVKFRYVKPE